MIPLPIEKFDIAPMSQRSSLVDAHVAIDMSKQLNRQNKQVNWQEYHQQLFEKEKMKNRDIGNTRYDWHPNVDQFAVAQAMANPFIEMERQRTRPKPKYGQLENPEILDYFNGINKQTGL